ncbi:hypothetical protein BOX15_Mlig024349g1 [Macrostomum lignano]|uniref:Small ribosomal subunit protein uS15m n=1 Tax=Macrostomum lignano TaxID=282301 RepID=A0A267F5G4_9PLAT|nr:hypothetical protein BOX15_Mlig024349g1 [Macrostomum lignano]
MVGNTLCWIGPIRRAVCALPSTASLCPRIITSGLNFSIPIRQGHWFTKYYSWKWMTRPISEEVLEKYEDRAKVKLPKGSSAPALLRKYLDESVPQSVKNIHSFEFMNFEAAVSDVIREKAIELGLDPAQESTANEIVRLTVRIRVQREQMSKKNSAVLERNLLAMLDRRRHLIEVLRSEDYAQFLRLVSGLELNFAHKPRPNEAEPPKPGFPSRLAETRDRCRRLRQRRLAELADRTEAAKAEFEQRRQKELKDAAEKLASLGLTLEQVLDEVYADRRARAETDLLEDQLHWYYGEQREHLKYVAKLAEKAKAAQTRGRK